MLDLLALETAGMSSNFLTTSCHHKARGSPSSVLLTGSILAGGVGSVNSSPEDKRMWPTYEVGVSENRGP